MNFLRKYLIFNSDIMDYFSEIENKIKIFLKSKKFIDAEVLILEALEKYPNHPNLLTIASDIYRAVGNREKSMEYAELLITHHPKLGKGYLRATEDLIGLKRFEEALIKIKEGLKKLPNRIMFIKKMSYINTLLEKRIREISDLEKDKIEFRPLDIITYSSVPKFFELIQSKRKGYVEEVEYHSEKKHVFIAGLGRSGTTALGKLLNISSLIEIYTELYSPFRIDGYFPSDFSRNKITEKLKTHPHRKTDLKTFSKHNNSKIIGDKLPLFQFSSESTFDNISQEKFKCIFIDRSLIDICRSTHKRSENVNDKWSLEKGIEHTVLLYNASCRQIIHLYENRPDIFSSFVFINYEKVFTSTEFALNLIDFLEVPLTDMESLQVQEFINKSKKVVYRQIESNNTLELSIRKNISKLIDHEVHEKFINITGNHRNYIIE